MAVSSSSRWIQELHSVGLGSPAEAIVDELRHDMTRDLPKMEKSGVLPWKEPACGGFALSAMLPAFSALTTPALCTDLMSELDSNENEWLLSLAFRRLKQMKTRSRKVLPPIANTMAVTMLIIDLNLRADSGAADAGDVDGGALEKVVGHRAMSEAMPQSPLLLPYLKPCCSPSNPVTT